MEQRLSMITLGVANLAHAKDFYETVVGWEASESPTGIAFFNLKGTMFALYSHDDAMKDMNVPEGTDPNPPYQGFAIAYNARSKEEVDSIFDTLRINGATITKEPQEVFWGGYSGYFADLDNHRWEVAYNPFWTIDEDGRINQGKE